MKPDALWVALLISANPLPVPPPTPSPELPASADALRGLSLWCLQFTPKVTKVEGCAIAMEVQASLRLFGGVKALKERISSEAPTLGVVGIGWAPTALGALVLARSEPVDLGARTLQSVLDDQPVTTLTAAAEHVEVLARIGVTRLGQLRRLPRDDVSQRWGSPILRALDQAYGRFPETFKWEQIPEDFSTRVELPAREDNAAALFQFAAAAADADVWVARCTSRRSTRLLPEVDPRFDAQQGSRSRWRDHHPYRRGHA